MTMPIELEIAIFGITWAAIAVGFKLDRDNYKSLADTQSKMVELRVQFRTMINLLGEKFARILHSPHTPEVDHFLDKLISHQELTKADVEDFDAILYDIENNVGRVRPKEERALAGCLRIILHLEEDMKAWAKTYCNSKNVVLLSK
jgi:hypothetical protein